ncbi:IclR family transcriptional regulator [Marinomonas piezotolerans]|uniref:HTH-type transcriptional repressor AllR n=1 Tax=Marinomonas piezotolerans TaxID=2213058 RepID=A0A370UCY8_9GAMM|nr:IclR family transcriptional regulator [Marinomonas piezotolerans]RDL45555.1 IclR family transcriptional regulator [Marinomonas piezotolerans]
MSSLNKMLNVLNIFGPESLVINVDDIAKKLSLSRATAYRYVKELCDAGLLTRIDTSYTLGPRIIELDWMMRQHDPLISHGREVMADLSKSTGLTVYMSVFYDGHIINTHIESDIKKYGYAFGRGRPLPIFKGAQSKVLVANQKTARLKKIFEEQITPDEDYDLTWKEFNAEAKKIRKDGFCVTHDELNLGLTGIAAPIISKDSDDILGSIAFVGTTSAFELFRLDAVVERLKVATELIEKGTHLDN